jgi:probable phosphoglycerate mutase
MIELMFVRHADPDYKNDTITEKGHKEAQALARFLKRHPQPLTAIVCSPFGRAKATMQYTADACGIEPAILPWLGEPDGTFDNGRWSWSIPRVEHLAGESLFDNENWRTGVPYGEKLYAIRTAIAKELDWFLAGYGLVRKGAVYRVQRPQDARIAVFTHEGFTKVLLSAVLHWPLPHVLAHLSYNPTGCTRLIWDEHDGLATPRAVTINDLAHLAVLDG